MRFKEHILEAYSNYDTHRSKNLFIGEAIDFTLKYATEITNIYKNSSARILRGASSTNFVSIIEPEKFERKSRNTFNYGTLLIDNSPKWKHYPKRSKSIICSSHCSIASGYGRTYVVFPVNGSSIGICEKVDMWDSFRKLRNKVWSFAGFNDIIHNIISYYMPVKANIPETYNDLVKIFNIIDDNKEIIYKKIKEVNNNEPIIEETLNVFNKYFTSDSLLLEYINDLLEPKSNGFDLMTTSTYNVLSHNEVWLSGTSILVTEAYFDTFMRRLNEV